MVLRGELAQLVVDQRQQLLGSVRVALPDGIEDASHLIHACDYNHASGGSQNDNAGGKKSCRNR